MTKFSSIKIIVLLGAFLAIAGLSSIGCGEPGGQNRINQTAVNPEGQLPTTSTPSGSINGESGVPTGMETKSPAEVEPENGTKPDTQHTPSSPVQTPITGKSTPAVVGAPTAGMPMEGPTMTPIIGDTLRHGVAISKSDVSGIPDSALTAGEVLFIPEGYAIALAETSGFDTSDTDILRHASFELEGYALTNLASSVAVIGADGRFPINIIAGRYFVCLADVFADHTAGPPYSVVGCDVVDLPRDASLMVSFGEGGIEAIPD